MDVTITFATPLADIKRQLGHIPNGECVLTLAGSRAASGREEPLTLHLEGVVTCRGAELVSRERSSG